MPASHQAIEAHDVDKILLDENTLNFWSNIFRSSNVQFGCCRFLLHAPCSKLDAPTKWELRSRSIPAVNWFKSAWSSSPIRSLLFGDRNDAAMDELTNIWCLDVVPVDISGAPLVWSDVRRERLVLRHVFSFAVFFFFSLPRIFMLCQNSFIF